MNENRITNYITNHITAFGHGEAKAMPDLAALTMTVMVQAADQAEAVRQNAEQAASVRAVLREIGVADQDIQTQHYRVQPQYTSQKGTTVLNGYEVQNSLQVTVRDLDQVGSVIDKVTTRSVSSVDYISFELSDRAQAEAEALSQAFVSAQRKAGVMAAAAGVRLGPLVSIAEGGPDAFPSLSDAGGTLSSAPAAADTPISAQQVTINAFVTLVYALEAAK